MATRNVYDPAPLANQHLGNNRAATQKGAAQVCLYVKPPFVGIDLPDRPYCPSTTDVIDEEVYWSKIGLYALYHRLYGVWVGHVRACTLVPYDTWRTNAIPRLGRTEDCPTHSTRRRNR